MKSGRLLTQLTRVLLVSLALGAATTVLVAWGLAAWLPHRNLVKRHNLVGSGEGKALDYVSVYELSRPGMIRRAWVGGYGGAPPKMWTELAPKAEIKLRLKTSNQDRSWGNLPTALEAGGAAAGTGVEDARGWPWPALWHTLDAKVIDGTAAGRPCPDGIAISKANGRITSSHFRALPVRPVWRGLAANTGVFAGSWFLAFLIAGWGKRRWRWAKGRCPECGYDLMRDLEAGCSECGWNRAGAHESRKE